MISDHFIFQFLLGTTAFVSLNLLFFINFLKNENYRFSFSVLLIILISIISGIRADNIGNDSFQYSSIYMDTYEYVAIEPSFLFLRNLLRLFSADYQVFFIVINLITNTFILLSFRKITVNYPLALSLYICTFLFLNMNVNIIRQGLAMSLVIYSIACLLNNENKKYWMFLIVSVLTHYTSVIFVACYFLKNVSLSTQTKIKIIVFFIMVSILLTIQISDVFSYLQNFHAYFKKIYYYFFWEKLNPWSIKHIYYLVGLITLFYFFKIKKINKPYDSLFVFYLFGICSLLLFKEEEMIADRIFYYFILIGIPLIINIKYFLRNKSLYYLIVFVGINIWYIKSIYFQYPTWFIVKTAIR